MSDWLSLGVPQLLYYAFSIQVGRLLAFYTPAIGMFGNKVEKLVRDVMLLCLDRLGGVVQDVLVTVGQFDRYG